VRTPFLLATDWNDKLPDLRAVTLQTLRQTK